MSSRKRVKSTLILRRMNRDDPGVLITAVMFLKGLLNK
jgi:hypothetical protein